MMFQKALRLQKLPPYVFAAVNEKKESSWLKEKI
jgi:hypothetical protein